MWDPLVADAGNTSSALPSPQSICHELIVSWPGSGAALRVTVYGWPGTIRGEPEASSAGAELVIVKVVVSMTDAYWLSTVRRAMVRVAGPSMPAALRIGLLP